MAYNPHNDNYPGQPSDPGMEALQQPPPVQPDAYANRYALTQNVGGEKFIPAGHTGSKLRWRSRLSDVKLSTCVIIALVIGLLIVGAAVGGAVGGTAALQHNGNKSKSDNSETNGDDRTTAPSPTPTSTTSSRSSVASSTDSSPSATPSSDCPNSNRTVYTSEFTNGSQGSISSSMGLSFQKLCSVDPQGGNIAQVTVDSFDRCIELCASLNFWENNKDCVGVSFSREGGVCWAHDNTDQMAPSDGIDGALLWEQ